VDIALAELHIEPFDHTHHNVAEFDCGHTDLNNFLKEDCPQQITHRLSFTRLAFYNGQIVGYVSLLADSIALHISIREWYKLNKNITVQQVPALKIGRLGIANAFKGRNIGTALVKYSVGVAFRMNDELGVGCRFITVDSDPAAVPFYEKLGFIMNLHRDYKGKNYPNMHYDIVAGKQIP
jgi:GNAT superfamily N-acetyltransferase